MSSPFHYSNPFCQPPPPKVSEFLYPLNIQKDSMSSSTTMFILFFSIFFFLLLITVCFQVDSQIGSIEDSIQSGRRNTGKPYSLSEDHVNLIYDVIKVPESESENTKDYKTIVTPKNGIVKLSKGVVTQTHHSIKEDSVIILSRKSIDGKAGTLLVVKDIVPNKKFIIHSLNSEGEIETEDCGDIYFAVI